MATGGLAMQARWAVVLWGLLLPCIVVRAVGSTNQVSSMAPPPLVIFVHGRGQNESTADEVRNRFFNSFLAEESKLYGQEVVPREALRFAWYADVIDPSAERFPDTQNCRFYSGAQLAASVL